jgi:hypothetical protein
MHADAPMALAKRNVRAISHFSSTPMMTPAANASPAPDGSTTCVTNAGISMVSRRFISSAPRSPMVMTTVSQPYRSSCRAWRRGSDSPVKRPASSSFGRKKST